MLVTAKFYNLVEAVVYIALHAKPNAVRGPEICLAQGLPARYLEADLQHLVRAGILKSVRGPKGGYVLAKERRNISVGDVYRTLPVDGAAGDGGGALKKMIAPMLVELENGLVEKFAGISIEALCNEARAVGAGTGKADFAI